MNKKIITGITAAALIGILGTSVFAASDTTTSTTAPQARGEKIFKIKGNFENMTEEEKAALQAEMQAKKAEFENMTEEEKAALQAERDAKMAEMKAKMTEKKAKWNALTDAQKEEIYKLQEARIDNEISMVKKYLELGLIDQTEADQQITHLEESKTNLKNGENMPFMSFGGQKGMKMKIQKAAEPSA